MFKIALLVLLIFCSSPLTAQTDKEKFFRDYEAGIDDLRRKNAEILSPEFFKKSIEYYEEAVQLWDEGKGPKRTRPSLEKSADYVRRAAHVVDMMNTHLSETIESREAALTSSAPLFSETLWEKGESAFREAALDMEDNNLRSAQKYGAEARDFFRQSELDAIKNGILGEARSAISLAVEAEAEKYCPNTIINARKQLAEAENLLNDNRYARDQAIQKARVALYEGQHAQYLAKTIQVLSKNERNWEGVILGFEEILINITNQFNHQPMFDTGFDPAAKAIMAYIANIKNEYNRLTAENAQLQEELNIVREKAEVSSAQLMAQKNREKKINKIKDLFSEDEAKVINQGDQLIIRLHGLKFPSGQAIIQPEYFSLLTRVQRALQEFPGQHFMIEGHTDSQGANDANLLLSEKRAAAVKEYLLANMGLDPDLIDHFGIGESRPVLSNETAEGRAMNRRIEVVITLSDL